MGDGAHRQRGILQNHPVLVRLNPKSAARLQQELQGLGVDG